MGNCCYVIEGYFTPSAIASHPQPNKPPLINDNRLQNKLSEYWHPLNCIPDSKILILLKNKSLKNEKKIFLGLWLLPLSSSPTFANDGGKRRKKQKQKQSVKKTTAVILNIAIPNVVT
jgi:hypothetical protein